MISRFRNRQTYWLILWLPQPVRERGDGPHGAGENNDDRPGGGRRRGRRRRRHRARNRPKIDGLAAFHGRASVPRKRQRKKRSRKKKKNRRKKETCCYVRACARRERTRAIGDGAREISIFREKSRREVFPEPRAWSFSPDVTCTRALGRNSGRSRSKLGVRCHDRRLIVIWHSMAKQNELFVCRL